jgi:coatomer subunit beta'
MDPSGKLIYTRNQEVLSVNLATLSEDAASEGARVPVSVKELGSTEVFAAQILHSPNGRFVTVVGDGEYIVYTALAWRNKSFGTGSAFAWAGDSNTYAVLEGKTKLRMYKNFKERGGAGMKGAGGWSIEGLYGGPLLAARGAGFVMFWDWESGEVVRRIDVDARGVHWSTSGTLAAITTEEGFFILRFDREAYDNAVAGGTDVGDEGVEEAFEVVAEISERLVVKWEFKDNANISSSISVKTAKWIGDCFIYTNAGNRLNYVVGTESDTITHFDS